MAIDTNQTKTLRRRPRTPKWVRRPGRVLSRNPLFARFVARLAIWYLQLTFRTNKWQVEPADAYEKALAQLPAIAAIWHGQHILLPVIPLNLKASVMISRSLDGEITAIVAEAFGARTIRASGGRDAAKSIQKGAMKGFLEMLAALERGESVMQTADIPKGTPRRAGAGIIALAKRSGRPIIPMAVASSRRVVFRGAWDRTTFNLPFGRAAITAGDPIRIPPDADDRACEQARIALEEELNRITKRAYELTGVPE